MEQARRTGIEIGSRQIEFSSKVFDIMAIGWDAVENAPRQT
jgi:hypothetical protein